MSRIVRLLGLLWLLAAGATAAEQAAEKETVLTLFDGHKVTLAVPEAFTLERIGSPGGTAAVRISGSKGTIELSIVFRPDPSEGALAASARARKEFMVREFQDYVTGSVEQAMQFEEFGASGGAGTYCAFTDAALVGKSPLPPNEFLNVTVGLKAWPGVCAVFKLFSNDTLSTEYRALLAVLRDHVRLQPVSPLK